MINLLDSTNNIESLFISGKVVFKILARNGGAQREIGMVTSKDDYERDLYQHLYTPLLFTQPLHHRLAYLYDCLNRSFKTPRRDRFIFMWRRIGTNDWNEWFEVEPYEDEVY